jgi:hypothetical protein
MSVPELILALTKGSLSICGLSPIMMSHMANLTLIYGLRLLPEGEVTEIEDARLKLANGHQASVTMHMIEGSREEIEVQLKRSLDAFFDFYPEI